MQPVLRLAATALLLCLSTPASALFLDGACSEGSGYLDCPSTGSAGTVTPADLGGDLTGLVFTGTVDSDNPVHVVAGECADLASRFPDSFSGAHALLNTTSGGGKVHEGDVTGPITIANLSPGATNQCAAVAHEVRGYADRVYITPPFTTTNTGTQKQPINWNAGIYGGVKIPLTQNADGTFKTAVEYIAQSNLSDMCQPGKEFMKGERIRVEWGEYANYRDEFDAFFADLHQYYASGACGGVARQLAIQLDYMANNKGADDQLCVPEEFRSPANGQNTQFVQFFPNNGGVNRCIARIYANAQILQAYKDDITRIYAPFASSPYLEVGSPKVEASAITSSQDSAFDPNTSYLVNVEIGQHMRSVAPRINVTLGTNNMQSGFDDILVTQYKPVMQAEGGIGVSAPDTWTQGAPGPRGATTTTSHGRYYAGHFCDGETICFLEWQFPKSRLDSTDPQQGWAGAIQAAFDETYIPTNPSNADELLGRHGGASWNCDPGKPTCPPHEVYGTTHTVAVLVFYAIGFNLDRLQIEYDAAVAGGLPIPFRAIDVNGVLNAPCPTWYTSNDLECVDNRGNVVP